MSGWEGVFGLLITVMIMVPAQFMACPLNDTQCVNGHLDDMYQARDQLLANKGIMLLALGFILAAASFNGLGVTVTKMTSQSSRVVAEQTRTIFIWIFFLMFQGTGHETFQIQKLFGFVLIVLGVLFYNRVLAFEGCRIRFLPKDEEVSAEAKEEDKSVEQVPNDKDEEHEPLVTRGTFRTQ